MVTLNGHNNLWFKSITIALLFQTSTSVTKTRGFASTADVGIRLARICASVSRDTRFRRTGLFVRTWTSANGNRAFAGTASAPTPTDRSSVCATPVTGCHPTGKTVSVRSIRFQTDARCNVKKKTSDHLQNVLFLLRTHISIAVSQLLALNEWVVNGSDDVEHLLFSPLKNLVSPP